MAITSHFPRLVLAAFSSAIIAFHDALVAVARSIVDFIVLAFVWLLPEPMRFALGGYGDFAPSGAPLDAALQQSMRHEAGIPRRSAARNI